MAVQALSIDLPPGISPDSKAGKKIIAKEKRALKARARVKETAENLMGAAIASGVSYGYGALEDKMPNNGKIPGTEIGFDLAGGIVLTGAGAVMNSKMASPMMFAGLGLLLPVLRDYGKAATFI